MRYPESYKGRVGPNAVTWVTYSPDLAQQNRPEGRLI
jgi:hypothetical protein